jgi:transcriptional regulator with XRE-family HTH domain
MKFGDRIKSLRKKQGLSQSEVGEAIGLSFSVLSTIELNKIDPSSETIVRLSEFFGVSADYLLTGKEEPTEISADEKEVIEIMRGNDDFKKAVKQAASFQKKAVSYLGNYAVANQNAVMG